MLALALTVWGWIKGGTSSLFGVVARYPWQALCAALLLACAWLWHGKDDAVKGRAADKATYVQAQAQAATAALAQKAKSEASLAQFAGVTNHDYEDGLADGRSSLAGWMRAHAESPPSVSPAAAQNHLAGLPEQPAPAPAVAINQQQLTGWDQDYQYALSCQAWAQGIAKKFDGKHWP